MREIKFRAEYEGKVFNVETKLPKFMRSSRYKGWWKRQGYIMRLITEHPFSVNRGYVPEHRLVMEEHLGRFLLPTEIIHHIDQNRENNEFSNLELQGSQGGHIYNSHLIGKRNPHGQIIANEPIFSEIKFRFFNKNTKTTRIYSLATLIGTTFRKGQFEFRGRFTGLLDKNGKEIYEGDILRLDENKEIVWIKCLNLACTKAFFDLEAKCKWDNGYSYEDYSEDWELIENKEVIGNIYESKHLLK